ncbi:MAG: TonB-dependent receptor [Fibrobacterota bacterium]
MRIYKLAAIFFAVTGVFAAGTGTISGKVKAGQINFPLSGAKIEVQGTNIHGKTDEKGEYRLELVPEGQQTVDITYLGYSSVSEKVNVEEGKTAVLDASLKSLYTELPKKVVVGTRQGQGSALNKQKTSDNILSAVSSDMIGRFPDLNSAEAVQRLPGINIQRDQGEGRFVQIRGSQPRLSNSTINGVSIPAPDGGSREVALDVVPSDILSSIEVNKAITPEMDGDAIGGSVNFNTQAPKDTSLSLSATAAGGYNAIVSDMNYQGALSLSKRMLEDGKLGLLLGTSYYVTNRGSDNTEKEWDYDEDSKEVSVDEMELRDYMVKRDRLGINAHLDYQLSDNTKLFSNFIFNRFGDDETRRRLKIKDDEFERETKDRYEVQDIFAVTAGGEKRFGVHTLDFKGSYAQASEEEPDRYDHAFVFEPDDENTFGDDPKFPAYKSANSGDPKAYDKFEIDEIVYENNLTTDKNLEAAVNYSMPVMAGKIPGEIKFGLKARRKRKERQNEAWEYSWEGDGDYTMDRVLGDFEDDDFIGGEYELGKFQDPDKVIDFIKDNEGDFEKELVGDDTYQGSYEAGEGVGAAYIQSRLALGNLSTLFGIRGEYTDVYYTGYIVDADEEYTLKKKPKTITEYQKYDKFLPMLHMKYSIDDNTNIRAAFTRSFARPNHEDLVPYVLTDDDEMEIGNPELVPTTSDNFDLMAERYFTSIGVLSGGVFFKSINGHIYESVTESGGYEVIQPINGEGSNLFGLEMNWQQQLTFLPGFADGFGVAANFTYTTAETEVVGSEGEKRTIDMPGQAGMIGNFSVSYEKFGFMGRLAMNYHSDFIDEVGDEEWQDRYHDSHLQLDASLSQRVADNLHIFAEFLNLANEPMHYYNEIDGKEYSMQYEEYKWWGHFGVKYSF